MSGSPNPSPPVLLGSAVRSNPKQRNRNEQPNRRRDPMNLPDLPPPPFPDDPDEDTQALLDEIRGAWLLIGSQLVAAVSRACTGSHRPVQHRDCWAPWCESCGRTADGARVADPNPAPIDIPPPMSWGGKW